MPGRAGPGLAASGSSLARNGAGAGVGAGLVVTLADGAGAGVVAGAVRMPAPNPEVGDGCDRTVRRPRIRDRVDHWRPHGDPEPRVRCRRRLAGRRRERRRRKRLSAYAVGTAVVASAVPSTAAVIRRITAGATCSAAAVASRPRAPGAAPSAERVTPRPSHAEEGRTDACGLRARGGPPRRRGRWPGTAVSEPAPASQNGPEAPSSGEQQGGRGGGRRAQEGRCRTPPPPGPP